MKIRKVALGTDNMVLGPAMSRKQALQAIDVGLEMADHAGAQRADLVGTGDMGIGNTTPSSAILSVISRNAGKSGNPPGHRNR